MAKKFDLKKMMNLGKKSNKSDIDNDELEEDFDEDLDLDDMDLEDGEEPVERKTSSKSNKKYIIIGGVVVAVVGLIAAIPYLVPSLFAPTPSEIVDNQSSIKPVKPVTRKNVHKKEQPKRNIHKREPNKIAIPEHKIKSEKQERHIVATEPKSIEITPKEPVKVVDIKKELEPEKQLQEIKHEEETLISPIEKSLSSDRLSGRDDVLALIDDKVVETRSFNDFLDQKLSNMDKLITYYKKKKELEELLSLYKKGYTTSSMNQQADEKVDRIVSELKHELSSLKRELDSVKKKKEEPEKVKSNMNNGETQDFENMTASFQNLNIYTKDGKYIAVLQTKSGDKIIKEGDMFNGYKIIKIADSMITFEKNGKRYYYNYAPSLNEEYKVTKIELPTSIKDDIERSSRRSVRRSVKEYTPINEKALVQETVNRKLKSLKREIR